MRTPHLVKEHDGKAQEQRHRPDDGDGQNYSTSAAQDVGSYGVYDCDVPEMKIESVLFPYQINIIYLYYKL